MTNERPVILFQTLQKYEGQNARTIFYGASLSSISCSTTITTAVLYAKSEQDYQRSIKLEQQFINKINLNVHTLYYV